jgi:hypothetical protein
VRSTFSIACIVLIFFNIHGYYAVLWGVQHNHAQRMEAALDAGEYHVSETVTFRIPITVPYATDDRGFERAEGVIFREGAYYRLFKQRLTMDTLYLVCFKDVRETHIRQQFSRHAQDFSGISGNGKSIPRLLGSTSEYYSVALCMGHNAEGWVKTLGPSFVSGILSAKHVLTPQQPPERG